MVDWLRQAKPKQTIDRLRAADIKSTMSCEEYLELERDYACAIRRWAQYAQPQSIGPPGKDQLQQATALRQEALVELNTAADTLHLHRLLCAVCRRQGAA